MNATMGMWLVGLPIAASPLIYLLGRLAARARYSAFPARWAAYVVLGVLWLLLGTLASTAADERGFTIGMIGFEIDAISLLMCLLALTLLTAVVIYARVVMRAVTGEEKFYAAVVVMTGAMFGMVCSTDLFNLWVWLELLTISSVFLVTFNREDALEAGVKYLVQSAVGSALVLLGIALVLLQTGALALDDIRLLAAPDALLLAGGALFVAGFGVKVALVPLHTWLPDAHALAPSSISALLSGIVIEVGLVLLLRVMGALSGVTLSWAALLLGCGALNMLAGNLLALRQTQVKRLLAFSSLSHVGYMLLGFGIALAAHDAATATTAAQGAFFHLLVHGLMKALAFMAAGALMYALGRHTLALEDLAGAASRYPLLAAAFTAALLSLGGLPPLAGFMSKWQIFVAGFGAQDALLGWLVLFAAANSLLSLVYYMPLVNLLYRRAPGEAVRRGHPLPLTVTLPLVVLALLLVLLGVFPQLLYGVTEPAAHALLLAFGG